LAQLPKAVVGCGDGFFVGVNLGLSRRQVLLRLVEGLLLLLQCRLLLLDLLFALLEALLLGLDLLFLRGNACLRTTTTVAASRDLTVMVAPLRPTITPRTCAF
jgi:hypothetical protein